MRTNFRSRTLFPNNILKNSRDQVYKRKEEPSKSKKEIKIVSQLQVNNIYIYIYISKMIITVDFLIITSNNERDGVEVKDSSCSSTTSKFLLSSFKNDRLYSSVSKENIISNYNGDAQKRMQYAVFKEIKARQSRANYAIARQDSKKCYVLLFFFQPFGHTYIPHLLF